MLVKVNSLDIIKKKIKVTQLDIDDFGSVIPLKQLELNISGDDESVIQTLKNGSYAAIFTEDNIEDNNSTIILANAMTIDELNKEKSKTIDKAATAREIWLLWSVNSGRCLMLKLLVNFIIKVKDAVVIVITNKTNLSNESATLSPGIDINLPEAVT